MKVWKAGKLYKVEVKVKGNHMTQKYYVDRLLLVYIDFMKEMNQEYPGSWLLQEDKDPSYGMKKSGLTQQLKDNNNIHNHKHPAQSLDLKSIEGIWNIIK